MGGRIRSVQFLLVILVSAFIALAPARPASAAHRPETPAQYSADCAGQAWDTLFQWFLSEHQVTGEPGPGYAALTPLCQHRATVLQASFERCLEASPDAVNNYLDGIAQDGDARNDWLTHMSEHCSWSLESIGTSIVPWYEGTQPI